MPRPVKQKPQRSRKRIKREGVSSRIKPVHGSHGGIKLSLYGRTKTGKTSFAATFPKPLLLIGTEDGTRSISNVEGVDFIMMRAGSDMDELVEMLQEGKYASTALDTGGGFQDIIVKEELGLEDVPVQRTYRMGADKFPDTRQLWGAVGIRWKEKMRRFLDLSGMPGGLNVIVIAHERSFNDDSDTGGVIFPTVGSALTPSAAGWLNGACDYLCQCFLREEKKKVTKGKRVVVRPTGKIEYCLRMGPHEVYQTGFRVPRGIKVPDVMVDPHYDKLVEIIRGE